MNRRKIAILGFAACAAFATGIVAPLGCEATTQPGTGGDVAGAAGSGNTTNTGASSPTTSGTGAGTGEGGLINIDGGEDANNDAMMNPCGTKCGPEELCDPDHTGVDDNCNGQVDESCDCAAGQAHSCFKGDPSYINTPGCYPGSMKCTENGIWGPCVGGVHATDDQKCYVNDVAGCHPISAVPFQDVNLKEGTGNFSDNAQSGTEVWTVTCPAGVNPCPAVGGVAPPDDFKPLQSGEYTITYTKGVAGGGTESCTYPLFVGAPGLRVELEWEHDLGDDGVDLDLHVHQPNNMLPWSIDGENQDCTWSNCTITDFSSFGGPDWFNGVAPPDPVDWYLDPVFEKNTCYFAPRGKGMEWQAFGQGCHNPRLDLDNIFCDPLVLDVDDDNFCAPENVNVDYPPKNEWFRIGVHYFSSHGLNYDVHPRIKIFCNGALAADLGPAGYYVPEAPITFIPSDGQGFAGNRFWIAADVAFVDDKCGTKACVVQPVYTDPVGKAPLLIVDTAAEAPGGFGPPFPPPP
ncbi:MAG: hypothetical protein IPK82_00680 [Polyangiaceae bacterium]|nr:hypothetical protein [Polyangiaceae bacterium]